MKALNCKFNLQATNKLIKICFFLKGISNPPYSLNIEKAVFTLLNIRYSLSCKSLHT